ncbi:MAG: hypothetical protein AB7U85_08260 [Alphaproteobacteria bacterium]
MKKILKKYNLWILVLLSFVVASCQHQGDRINQESEMLYPKSHRVFRNYTLDGVIYSTDDIPQYDVGDAFLYSDGYIEVVSDVDANYIKWQLLDGSFYISSKNIFLPAIKKVINDGVGGTITIENDFDIKKNFLWPIRVGLYDKVDVKETVVSDGNKQDFKYQWECLVVGDETINNSVNKFDTFVVECNKKRYGMSYEKQIFYYAPEVGKFARVSSVSYPNDIAKTIDIVAYGLMPSAMPKKLEAELISFVQYALETRLSGVSITKKSGELLIEVKPYDTYQTDKGYFCRDYEQKLTVRGRISTQKGTACKSDTGIWQTPAPKG